MAMNEPPFGGGQRDVQLPDFGEIWRTYRKVIIPAVVLILITIPVLSSFFTVKPNEQAVILRFGRILRTEGPGLHFKVPFIDRYEKVEVKRIFTEAFGFRTIRAGVQSQITYNFPEARDESFMLTGDINCAVVTWSVLWRVKNVENFLFKVRDIRRTIRDVSQAVMRRLVGDRSIDEVLLKDREGIRDLAKTETQAMLDEYECGVLISDIELKDTDPPKEVQGSFEEVNQAKQIRETKINEAEGKRNREIEPAEGKKLRIIEAAKGYAKKRINEAEGDTQAFLAVLAEYESAKEVTRKRLYLETMGRVLPGVGRIYVIDESNKGLVQLLDLKAEGKAKR